MKTNEGKLFASMPAYKTNQVDENGKAVYKDICYPVTKEFRDQLQKDVVNAYLEVNVGIEQPNHATLPHMSSFEQAMEDEIPFDKGFQDPAETKPERAEVKTADEKKPEKPKTKKDDKPKSIKERLAEGEAKKKARIAENADKPKVPKKEAQIA